MNEATRKHKYRVSFGDMRSHPEGASAVELEKEQRGGADALLLASLIYPEDGTLSLLFRSLDGRTGKELEDREWFKIWTLMGKRLAASKTLDPARREFARMTFDMFLEMVGVPPHCNEPGCAVARHNNGA